VPRLPQLGVGGGWAILWAWNMVGIDLSLLLRNNLKYKPYSKQ
jgi:hypothetical protein